MRIKYPSEERYPHQHLHAYISISVQEPSVLFHDVTALHPPSLTMY